MATPISPSTPRDAYAVFCGEINERNAQELIASLATATGRGQNIHLLFQTSGGSIGDGVCLYNFFRSLLVQLTIYNVGSVNSAGVIAYLGGKRRITSPRAIFMIHRVTVKLVEAPAMVMQGVTKNLIMNDARSESIMREHVTLIGEEKWSNLDYYDFYFSGEEAVKMGLAQELGEFSPPTGTPVHFFYPLPGRS